MTATPTGRARGGKQGGPTKSVARRTNTRAAATPSVLDLVDDGSEIDGDAVIDLSATRAPAPAEAPAIPDPVPDPRLLALGLPVEFTPPGATVELRAALKQRLSHLPPVPVVPRTRGVVIAIVGIGAEPTALVRRLAGELRVAPDNVLLPTPEAMSGLSQPEDADAFRRICRRRSGPTIVACSTGSGRAQLGWARRILGRLQPTITWAVVDASVKTEDVAHRVGVLGGVDVIALTGIADTMSPAATLALGIPVGRIGAQAATPEVWTDVLMERLER
jgi:hypothetical protein